MRPAAVFLRWIAPVFAGGLITLSFAPFHLWPCGIAGVMLMALVWRQQSPRLAALSGWLFGVGLFGTGASWVYVSIHVYGDAPIPLAAMLTALFAMGLALFPALQGWLMARYLRRDGAWLLLSLPGIWVLFEWFRSWLLTGFPWLFLGHAHVESPLAGWAPVLGTFGVSFIVALTGSALATLLFCRNRLTWSIAGLVAVLWISGFALRHVEWSHPVGEPIKVAVVQANIPQEIKWEESQRIRTVNIYRELSAPYWGYDLLIWPETAVPFYLHEAEPLTEEMDTLGKQKGTTWISGIPTVYPVPDSRRYQIFNSIVAMGQGAGIYHKQRLVPFGEYVPMESLLRGLIEFFDLPMSAFSVGPANQKPLIVGKYHTAPFICYEIVYGDFVADHAAQVDFLLTISNDAWFGDSLGPHQHLQIAQMRALENARDLVRSTNNGISALTDEHGKLLEVSGQFRQEVMTGEITPRRGTTPYMQTGSMPILVIALVLSLLSRDTRRTASR